MKFNIWRNWIPNKLLDIYLKSSFRWAAIILWKNVNRGEIVVEWQFEQHLKFQSFNV